MCELGSPFLSGVRPVNTDGAIRPSRIGRSIAWHRGGRGPKDNRTHRIGDLLVVRLRGVLTATEQQLAGPLPSARGRYLHKEVRTQLVDTARPAREATVHGITGLRPASLHHDISTAAGEEVVVLTLAEAPAFHEAKKR